MFYPLILRFLNDLIYWYTPTGETRNTIYDIASSNQTTLSFGDDYLVFYRYKADPPILPQPGEDCNIVPGQPESRIIIKLVCCDSLPRIVSRMEWKHNGWWLTKSLDVNTLIPGVLSVSNFGSGMISGGIRPCQPRGPMSSSVFTTLDWEEFFIELIEVALSTSGSPDTLLDYIKGDLDLPCTHPLLDECSFTGYQITLLMDYTPQYPWIPIKLPQRYESLLDAFMLFQDFILNSLGLLTDGVTIGEVTYIANPLTLIVNLALSSNEDFCELDAYFNRLQVGFRFCPCPPGEVYKDGECRELCPEGSFWSPAQEKCVTCPPCSFWNEGLGQCVTVSNCLDNEPHPENPDIYWDPDNRVFRPKPQPDPPSNDPGWRWDGDEWVFSPNCPPGTYFDGINCVAEPPIECPPNKHWNGSSCVDDPPPSCPPDTFWDGTTCRPDCPPGTSWNGQSCVEDVPVCPPGCYFDGTSCVCSNPPPSNPYPAPEPDPTDYPIPRIEDPRKDPGPIPELPDPPGALPECSVSSVYCDRGPTISLPGRFEWEGTAFEGFVYRFYYPAGEKAYNDTLQQVTVGGYTYQVREWNPSGRLINPTTGVIIGGNKSYVSLSTLGPQVVDRNAYHNNIPCNLSVSGIWYIRVFYKVNISSLSCIPGDLVIGWFINKFLQSFNVYGGYGNTYFGQHYTTFGPASSNDPAPYLDTTMQAPLWTFRWKALLYTFDPYVITPWLPCTTWTATPIHTQTIFTPL